MLQLACDDLSLGLLPEAGGAIVWFAARGVDVLRRGEPAAVMRDPTTAACFPLVPYSGPIVDGRFRFGGTEHRLARNHPNEPDPIHGEGWLARAGFAAAATAYCGLALAVEIPHLVVVATISAFGNGVLRPVITGQVSQAVGPGEQGTVLGINQSLASLAAVLGPALGGVLIEQGLLTAWALTSAGIGAIGFLFTWLRPGQPAPAASPQ